jgi:thioredoxin:protein disulfide reductase
VNRSDSLRNSEQTDRTFFFPNHVAVLLLMITVAATALLSWPSCAVAVDRAALPVAALQEEDSGRIIHLLFSSNLPVTLVSFFGFGLLLSLTPCVFPMIPILSGIIAGQGAEASRKRTALLSGGYVLGMAVTYALAGVAAALSGTMLAGALQNVWVLGSFALLFVILALSMFGYFELHLPASLQTSLNAKIPRGTGSMIGTILMGGLSALVVSPCVAAPLAGALLYIAKTGNLVIGGSALFCMALGMGVPLMLVGTLTGSILPRAGAWMEVVKKGFGLLLLGVAAWLLKPVAPEGMVEVAWAALLVGGGIGLYRTLQPGQLKRSTLLVWRGVSVVTALIGCLLFANQAAGPQGLAGLLGIGSHATPPPPLVFLPVSDLKGIEQHALSNHRPVMVFVTADWCSWCKKMHHTLDDPDVRYQLKGFDLLMADISDVTKDDKKIMRRFGIMGPPGVVFVAADQGKMQIVRSVMGYQKPEVFIKIIRSISRQQSAQINHDRGRL